MPLSENQIKNMEQKRERILYESVVLFSELGFEGTTIKKVAKAAEVSFGSVFTYFENKDQLFHATVTEPLADYERSLLDFDPQANDPVKELESMVVKHIEVFSSISHYLNLVVHVISHNKKFPDTFTVLDAFHQNLRNQVRELVAAGQKKGVLREQDPTYAAVAYTSLLMGLRLNLTDEPDSDTWEHLVPSTVQLFGPK
ncbi:TetR/AcrR family transcriptional regulator [Alteribacter keqinensis]|uniref:TetR/AcrR family transcriptional regulator n=1 Tax=Alteribacter keqinensis TaxID=2483800 RepID=A0A3M7TM35_9BACI|nr:TetR/AcrR family transcriptional regulator [Alteribacter keqinensis]RNA66671.1 TetR/AcrR family transcriptional regulator [Alteribacter keqinensis]